VAKFDRYLLSQLMMIFGFFALVMVMIFWINPAVQLFDQLIANGHSAMVFLEFSALILPGIILNVMPLAAFGAAIYCANRLSADSELVVVQSTGFSPYRLARPVVLFGIIVGLLVAILANVLVPSSNLQLAERRSEIQANSTARFLQEGKFLHPASGVTFYIKDISAEGVMDSMFLADRRNADQTATYSATRAMLARSDTGPKLIMLDGMVQNLRLSDQRLSTTQFSEFVFDIGPLLAQRSGRRVLVNQLPTSVLMNPTTHDMDVTGSTRAAMLQAGHARFEQSVLSLAAALAGFCALLMGGYSRFGLWRQIFFAVFVIILIKTVDNYLNGIARRDASRWLLVYGASLMGLWFSWLMLWLAAHPSMFSRRIRQVAE